MTNSLIYPILFLVIVTLIVGFVHTYGTVWLLNNDKKWKKGGIPLDPKLASPEWLIMIKNNLINLFEFPIIFYLISTISYLQNINDVFLLTNCWIYVLLRGAHSFMHIKSMDTNIRGALWLFSQVVVSLIVVRFIMLI
ncbi:MAG: MAPEG family protein [Pelagibacterales bacterium]|nr:MAPEG family protein [Pelagibacterales bacterium]